MFHTRELNRKINHIHERALRIVCRDNCSSFTELLKKDNSVCICNKVKHTISNSLMLDIFPLRSVDYNIRTQTDFIKPSTNTTRYNLKSLNFFASKMWDMISDEIKSSSTVEIFKNKIRKRWPIDYDCHICRTYISKIGYVSKCNELSSYT